jgi:hypothetical protein
LFWESSCIARQVDFDLNVDQCLCQFEAQSGFRVVPCSFCVPPTTAEQDADPENKLPRITFTVRSIKHFSAMHSSTDIISGGAKTRNIANDSLPF